MGTPWRLVMPLYALLLPDAAAEASDPAHLVHTVMSPVDEVVRNTPHLIFDAVAVIDGRVLLARSLAELEERLVEHAREKGGINTLTVNLSSEAGLLVYHFDATRLDYTTGNLVLFEPRSFDIDAGAARRIASSLERLGRVPAFIVAKRFSTIPLRDVRIAKYARWDSTRSLLTHVKRSIETVYELSIDAWREAKIVDAFKRRRLTIFWLEDVVRREWDAVAEACKAVGVRLVQRDCCIEMEGDGERFYLIMLAVIEAAASGREIREQLRHISVVDATST